MTTTKPNPEQTKVEIRAIVDQLAGMKTNCSCCGTSANKGKHMGSDGWIPCTPCHGTGKVARHPWARRECSWCRGRRRILKHYLVIGDEPYVPTDEDYDPCTHCTDGWVPNYNVRESAVLAGLTPDQAFRVLQRMAHWCVWEAQGEVDIPREVMLSGDEVHLAFLQAVEGVVTGK